MTFKVLIVDDSTFFRKRLIEIISADPLLEIAGEAKNGREGVDMALALHPDVITMDIEMPVLDGISAVKEIMAKNPTPVLMFSSLTTEGASATMKALEAGAVDFMPKNFQEIASRKEDVLNGLRSLIRTVARSRYRMMPKKGTAAGRANTVSAASSDNLGIIERLRQHTSTVSTAPSPRVSSQIRGEYDRINNMLGHDQGVPAAVKFSFGDHQSKTTGFKKSNVRHSILAIGSSTGGPIALQNVIPKLPRLNVPVVIVQHMPGTFTKTFAQRLDEMSKLHVVEASDGDILQPDWVYIAPGGMQMIFERAGNSARIRILKDNGRVNYNPCVDVSFASLAQIYGSRVLGIILTGMGSDGCEGCRLLKNKGAVIWAQNEASCVVYGMPQAVVNAGIADLVLPLDELAADICREF